MSSRLGSGTATVLKMLPAILDFILPERCACCDSLCREMLCDSCKKRLLFISHPICTLCGLPFASDAVNSHLCGECMKRKRYFSAARSVIQFGDACAHAIHNYKYRPDTSYARSLGWILTSALSADRGEIFSPVYRPIMPDIVVPVPLHKKRLRERGFNQSLLLARCVGNALGIPVDYNILERTRWTEPQVKLSGKDRRSNVKGAFEVVTKLSGRNILLIDDVYTTGATIDECSKVLSKKGAGRISVLTLARTVL